MSDTVVVSVTDPDVGWHPDRVNAFVDYVRAGVPGGSVAVVSTSERGPVETAYRSWIHGLGRLSPRQTAIAEQVYAVAANLDTARDNGTPAAAVSSLSRALLKVADALPTGERADQPAVPTSPVDGVDQVAEKRRQRKARAGAPGA